MNSHHETGKKREVEGNRTSTGPLLQLLVPADVAARRVYHRAVDTPRVGFSLNR